MADFNLATNIDEAWKLVQR